MLLPTKPDPAVIEQLRTAYPKGAPRIDYREMTLSVAKRAAEPDADGAPAADTSPIHLSMSSEAPVLRYDWWEGEYYYEILDHSKESVDLSYARDGMPFVASHRSYDADQQHGIVENITVEDRRLMGDVIPSRAQRSQEIANDMRDGIRKKVSIGYIVGDEFTQTETKGDASTPTRRYTSWMPMELSTVPVPADYDVGIGRAASPDGRAALSRFLTLHPASTRSAAAASPAREAEPSLPTTAPKAEERTMKDGENAAAGAPAAGGNANGNGGAGTGASTITVKEMRDNETQRISNIRAWARDAACEDKVSDWIAKGASEDDVVREINSILTKRMKEPIKTTNGPDLSPKDLKRFSFARAIMLDTALVKEFGGRIDLEFEREVIQETLRLQGSFVRDGGGNKIMPYTLLGRAGVDSTSSTTGGPFKFAQPGDFIPVLRNKAAVVRAGATVLTGLTGPLTFPKQTAAAATQYTTENPGSAISITNLLTTTLTLSFKSLGAATAFSRQLIFSAASGNYDAEAIVQGDLAAVMGLAIDLGALNCADANGPRGLLQNTNIGSVTLGAQGGTVSWGPIVDLETLIGDANADTDRMAYITNTKIRGSLKKKAPLDATNSAIPIWSGNPAGNDGVVNGYRAIASNQAPRNLTKGTTSTVCSAVVFGAWEHQLIGVFGPGYDTIVDPYSSKFKGMIEVAAWVFFDANQRYDGAFSAILDATG